MIKAVFFDFYNTVGRFWPPREELQATACEEFGIKVTPGGVEVGYGLADAYMAREVAQLPLRDRDRQGIKDFFAEYQRLILQGAGVDVPLDLALSISARLRQLSYGYALFDDVLPTLDALKQRGLTLGLLSNNEGDMGKVCEELGLSPYLDFTITSADVGASKPHPPIFIEALRIAQAEPPEAMHVGDQLDTDIRGALAMGIHPVLLDRDRLNEDSPDFPRIEGLGQVVDLLKGAEG